MSMTIRELADELGVSKEAIRKRLTPEFRANYVTTGLQTNDKTIHISQEGCDKLAQSWRQTANSCQPKPDNNRQPSCQPNQEQKAAEIELLKETISLLKMQLIEKDKQIAEKDKQLAAKDEQIIKLTDSNLKLTDSVTNEQQIHAFNIKQLTDSSSVADEEFEPQKKRWWQKRRK